MDRYILVVEDDDDIRTLVRDILEEEGYLVETAEHGRAALTALAAHADPPALILLDHYMPIMDGQHFVSAYRTHCTRAATPAAPVVFMSAASVVTATATDLGVVDLLRKPFGVEHLLQLVGRHAQLQPA